MAIKPIIVHTGEGTFGEGAAQERSEAVAATARHIIDEGGRIVTAFTVAFNAEGEPMVQTHVTGEIKAERTLTIAVAETPDEPYTGPMAMVQGRAVPAHLAEIAYGEM